MHISEGAPKRLDTHDFKEIIRGESCRAITLQRIPWGRSNRNGCRDTLLVLFSERW
jgi:hypothetical protein